MAGLRIPGVPVASLGKPNGVATLDANGHLPAEQGELFIPDSIWLSPAVAGKAAQVSLGTYAGLPALVVPQGHTGGSTAMRFLCRLPAGWETYSSRIWWTIGEEGAGDVTLRSRFIGNGQGVNEGASLPSFVTTDDKVVAAPAPNVIVATQSNTTRQAPLGLPVMVHWERRGVSDEGDTLDAPIYVIGVEVIRVT